MRKLALVMALTAAGLPNWASALGLGDIDLNSNLNQPLEAEIPLRAVNQDELDSLHVGLASRADFARAGIDYQNSLRQLNFQVVRSGDQPVIKVTSNGDFREPYVSFLLEVNWNSGRIMREYTMLVDPPVIAGRGGAAVSAPRVQAQARAPQSQPQTAQQPQRRSVASQPRGLPRGEPQRRHLRPDPTLRHSVDHRQRRAPRRIRLGGADHDGAAAPQPERIHRRQRQSAQGRLRSRRCPIVSRSRP